MHKTVGWWNKYHSLVLLVSVCLTLLSIKWFISPEINKLDFVLAVFFTVVLFVIITQLSGFDSWDKLARGIPGYFFGFLLVSWGWYLQILYWERKNRKIIVVSGYFKPTVSAINLGDNK